MFTFNEALGKKPPGKEPSGRIAGTFKIQKSIDEKRLAFGWASVAATAAGDTVTDYYEDIIVQFYREGGEMHERGGCAVLVESVIFTKEKMAAMGIPEGVVPEGWWIGFKVTDDEVWEKVKDGTYPMFSIEGEAVREEVDEEPEN